MSVDEPAMQRGTKETPLAEVFSKVPRCAPLRLPQRVAFRVPSPKAFAECKGGMPGLVGFAPRGQLLRFFTNAARKLLRSGWLALGLALALRGSAGWIHGRFCSVILTLSPAAALDLSCSFGSTLARRRPPKRFRFRYNRLGIHAITRP